MVVQHQLRPTWRRNFIHTTRSMRDLPKAGNIPNRRYNPEVVNRAWGRQYHLYPHAQRLAVSSSGNGLVLAQDRWAIPLNMPAELVCLALQMVIAQRQPPVGLVIYSDRGSQYASAAHRAVLDRHGLVMSMSRKGTVRAMR